MRLEAMLLQKMRSLCHVDPLLCSDGLALNTARCLVPGCILRNERLLLGFWGSIHLWRSQFRESKQAALQEHKMCKYHREQI